MSLKARRSGAAAMEKYSVLIPLGHREPVEYVRPCLNSVVRQTVPPDEIVFVCDHHTPDELRDVICEIAETARIFYSFVDCTDIHKRGGHLGAVLARGVRLCVNELIARMDADDIAPLDRCERQLCAFESDETLALVGGAAAEFTSDPTLITGYRRPPADYESILKFAKYRNPFNHSSVMFRRSAVLAVGNYSQALHGCEDYDLWYRLLAAGYKGINLPEVLLYSRVGNDLFRRRQNPENTASYFKVKKKMLQSGYITRLQYLVSGSAILFLRHAPRRLVKTLYKKFLRKAS